MPVEMQITCTTDTRLNLKKSDGDTLFPGKVEDGTYKINILMPNGQELHPDVALRFKQYDGRPREVTLQNVRSHTIKGETCYSSSYRTAFKC